MEILQPLPCGESLNSISKHCPGHVRCMLVEKSFECRSIAFADFAKHPAHGFMDKIVRIVDKECRDRYRCIKLSFANKHHCCDNRDPTFPKVFRACQAHQGRVRAIVKIMPHNFVGRGIHEIPVINPLGRSEVGCKNYFLGFGIVGMVLVDEDQ